MKGGPLEETSTSQVSILENMLGVLLLRAIHEVKQIMTGVNFSIVPTVSQ